MEEDLSINPLVGTLFLFDRPGADQTDETWLRWFQQFERLLQPLQRINDELERTVEAMRT